MPTNSTDACGSSSAPSSSVSAAARIAAIGVRSSWLTLATKSRRIFSSRRSSVTSLSTVTTPRASGCESGAARTRSRRASRPPTSISAPPATPSCSTRVISSASSLDRITSIGRLPTGAYAIGASSRSARLASTICPTPSVTSTPSTMVSRIPSSRSRSSASRASANDSSPPTRSIDAANAEGASGGGAPVGASLSTSALALSRSGAVSRRTSATSERASHHARPAANAAPMATHQGHVAPNAASATSDATSAPPYASERANTARQSSFFPPFIARPAPQASSSGESAKRYPTPRTV